MCRSRYSPATRMASWSQFMPPIILEPPKFRNGYSPLHAYRYVLFREIEAWDYFDSHRLQVGMSFDGREEALNVFYVVGEHVGTQPDPSATLRLTPDGRDDLIRAYPPGKNTWMLKETPALWRGGRRASSEVQQLAERLDLTRSLPARPCPDDILAGCRSPPSVVAPRSG